MVPHMFCVYFVQTSYTKRFGVLLRASTHVWFAVFSTQHDDEYPWLGHELVAVNHAMPFLPYAKDAMEAERTTLDHDNNSTCQTCRRSDCREVCADLWPNALLACDPLQGRSRSSGQYTHRSRRMGG